jgi:hypothetical protein
VLDILVWGGTKVDMEARNIWIAGRLGLFVTVEQDQSYLAVRRLGEARELKATAETVFAERPVIGCHLSKDDVEYFKANFSGKLNPVEKEILSAYQEDHDFMIILPEGHSQFGSMLNHEITHALYRYLPKMQSIARRLWRSYGSDQKAQIISSLKEGGYHECEFIEENIARAMDGTSPIKDNTFIRLYRVVNAISREIFQSLTLESFPSEQELS